MAGQSRTLKLSILGDVDQLKRSLTTGTKEVQTFGSKVSDFGKKAGLAFAAAGAAATAYAGKLAIDGVKAAIADEAAQAKLATTLQNVTGATSAQIAAVEAQILKTSLLTGVTDDELRPSFDRLVRSTKDVEEATRLQALALDISAGSGKSLEAVTNALAKASEGQNTALGKLGVGISAAELKTMSFEQITAKLSDTFANQASVQADTFAGKMARLNVAIDEGKETVGSFILDAITPLVSGFVNKVIPAIQDVAAEIGPKLTPAFKALGDYFTNVLIPAFTTLYNFIRDYIVPILNVTLIPIVTALAKAWTTIADALRENSDELEPLRAAFYAFAGFLRDTVAPIIGTFVTGAIGGIAGVISALIGVVGDVTTAVTSGFNTIRNFFTGSIQLISDTAEDLISGMASGISGVVSSLSDIVGNVETAVVSGLRGVRNFFTYVSNFISESAGNLVSPIVDVFRAAINTIIGLWNRLDFRITFDVPSWVPIIGGDSWRSPDIFPDIPMLANGGIVNSPTLAMIGEAGPEAVIPLNRSGLMGNNINVTVNGAIDPESTARQIITILNNSSYRGTLGAGAFAS
jgi:phage-related protein